MKMTKRHLGRIKDGRKRNKTSILDTAATINNKYT